MEEILALKKELEFRKTNKRDEIRHDLRRAEELGDLFHENFPYDEAVAAQRLNEARIVEIEHALESLLNQKSSSKNIQLGSVITLEKVDGTTLKLILVDEAVFKSRIYPNGITVESPIGKALLNHKPGDIVKIDSLDKSFKILTVD